jgi:L-threonylcarbamoyladenylate synthase
MSKNHYSPRTKVVIDQPVKIGDGLIALAHHPTPPGVIRLASPKSVEEFAKDLYRAFRIADSNHLNRIVINSPEESGIGVAILDRIIRASAK